MSRLDSFIRRLEAQRACLNQAALAIAALPGPVLELGLGNGRTYDHLRELLPGREIFVFEREPPVSPEFTPDNRQLGASKNLAVWRRWRLNAAMATGDADGGSAGFLRSRGSSGAAVGQG